MCGCNPLPSLYVITGSSGPRGAAKQGVARPETTAKKGIRNRKSKKPRMKHPDSSDSTVSNRKPRPPLQGLNQTSWSPSEASQSAFNVSYPAMVPTYPLYPPAAAAPAQAPLPSTTLSATFGDGQNTQAPATASQFPAPIVTPVVALLLPNYMFSQVGQLGHIGQLGAAPRPPFFPEQTQAQPAFAAQQPFQPPQPTYTIQTQAAYTSQQQFPVQTAFAPQQPFQTAQTPYTTQQPFQVPQTAFTTQQPFAAQPPFPVQPQFVAQTPYTAQPFPYSIASDTPKSVVREGAASRSSTPASGAREPATSPPLFESRCSSPLQLNLLSMEEGHRSVERQDSTAPSAGVQVNSTTAVSVMAVSPGEKNRCAAPSENHQQVRHRLIEGHCVFNIIKLVKCLSAVRIFL